MAPTGHENSSMEAKKYDNYLTAYHGNTWLLKHDVGKGKSGVLEVLRVGKTSKSLTMIFLKTVTYVKIVAKDSKEFIWAHKLFN